MGNYQLFLGLIAVALGSAVGQDHNSFEVAAIKPNASGEPFPDRRYFPSGQLSLENYTMKQFIAEAYAVRNDQIIGAPAWFASDRFDVTAKTYAGAPAASVRVMLQNLLAERFGLVTHKEEKTLPVFVLVMGKSALKLTPTTGSKRTFCAGLKGTRGQLHRACTNMTMEALAEWLPKMSEVDIDLPVVDLTGLAGAFDFNLDWSPAMKTFVDGTPVDADGPTIFDAVRHLGLILDRRKLPAPVIVIDHVQRMPTAN